MLPGLIDLASELVGGEAVSASDEFFAPKTNLLKSTAPIFAPDKYTERGKWMDGWESRRKRTPGHDWCVIRLGLAGVVRTVDVDTSYFVGNFPEHCSLDGAAVANDPTDKDWIPVLVKVRLAGGGHNIFDVQHAGRLTHVRLNIFPDGGVARLRVYGEVIPDLETLKASPEPVDFASVINGGRVLETRRRRGPGYDWIIVQLGARAEIQKISVETEHYKGNYPDRCSIDLWDAPGALVQDLITGRSAWSEIVVAAKLEADTVRQFESEFQASPAATHVRLNIYPDGGVSRLRVFGKIVE
jgi:allantoicase